MMPSKVVFWRVHIEGKENFARLANRQELRLSIYPINGDQESHFRKYHSAEKSPLNFEVTPEIFSRYCMKMFITGSNLPLPIANTNINKD